MNMESFDTLFVLIGAILVLFMHSGFAFLEVGTVRKKNQVNALMKILSDFALSTVVYFFVGYSVAYGTSFFVSAEVLSGGNGSPFAKNGYDLVKFFFLLTFAAAIPAIISGGVAERMRFKSQLLATAVIVGIAYPFFEGLVWNNNFGFQDLMEKTFGYAFNDFAGSVVVHAFGGWLALGAVVLLGTRIGRYKGDKVVAIPPSSIPFLALGSWILIVGWFGFNVMSAQAIEGISGLVAINSLMAMIGGTLGALIYGRFDPGFTHNGALAGLVAVCAGSNVMHPIGSLIVGIVAGLIFVWGFFKCQDKWKIDDVLGVWPLHGMCGAWGGISAGIFGQTYLGGMGGVGITTQIVGTLIGVGTATIAGFVIFGIIKLIIGIRLSEEEEKMGSDLAIHKVSSTCDD